MADMIKFYKGELTNLPSAGTNGALYITTDEGAIYLGTGVGMKRLGDFVQVDAVANLPTAGANTSALYYCVAENVLAKWNGTEWKQVNKQPTKDELKVMLGLDATGAVTQAIAAAKKAGDDAQEDVDNLTTYVGTFTHSTAKSVVEYIDAKTEGIATSGNLEALADRVAQAEKDIDAIEADYLKAADKTALETKITAAQTAADNAQSYAEGVAGDLADHEKDAVAHITAAERETWNGKTTMAEVEAKNYLVAADIAGKADADTVYTKDEIDAKVETINGNIDLKANAADVYDKDAIDAKVEALGDEDERLAGLIAGKVEQSAYNTKVGELEDEDERLAGLISDNATAIADEVTNRGTAISGLKTELEGKIDLKADQTALDAEVKARGEAIEGLQGQINLIMNNPDTEKVVDSITEFTAWVEEHGTLADGMRADIDKNKEDIAAEVKRAGEAETALSGRLDVLEAIEHDAYIAADTALKNELTGEIAKKADITALNSAVQALESADTGLGNRITALETNSATKTELQGVADDLSAYENAHAGDYTNAQIDAAIDADVKVVADELKAYKEAHASDFTNEQINNAIANAGHASATDLANHVADTVSHVTASDKEKWNGAQAAAEATAATALATARTEITAEIDADVKAEADRAKGIEAGLQTAIDTINNADNGILAQAKSDATSKANTAESNAKSYVDGLLTWTDF